MPALSAEPRWIDRLAVESIHFDQIQIFGGLYGLKDDAGLESALARARNKWLYNSNAGIYVLAAAYGFGLCQNHPFNDGNKRVAFVVMAVFAELNGYELVASETDVVMKMLQLASGELGEGGLVEWLGLTLVSSSG